ncbi:RICIN domain-containing protein [Streptomyces sp. NPDC053513]|uniref:RICIN domain-containing protein n=1 Tax=unclassified Streptomyces TaxID=2593676 RepID=UPI0037D5083C
MILRRYTPRSFAALVAVLLLAAALVPLSAASARAASPICLSGALEYDFLNAEEGPSKPLRSKRARTAAVELWGNEKPADAPRLLASGFTATINGDFNLCYTPTTTTAMSSLWVRFNAQYQGLWKVTDNSGRLYSFDTPTRTNVSASTNLGTVKAPAASSRAWHAFDTVFDLYVTRTNDVSRCWTTRETDNNACTGVTVRWGEESKGTSFDAGIVQLSGADPDSQHVTLHELGHFFMWVLYGRSMPAVTNCTWHYIAVASSDTCAWTEGFADAVSTYVSAESPPRYVFNNGDSFAFTYGNGWGVGDTVQGNVAGALIDMSYYHDAGWARTIDLLAWTRPATFAQYFAKRPAAYPPLATTGPVLDKLLKHAIDYGPSIVGDGKYHTLTNGSGLALEHANGCSIPFDGSVVYLAPVDTNRPQQRWKVTANADGTVTITDGCSTPFILTAQPTGDSNITARPVSQNPPYRTWNITKTNGTVRIGRPDTGSLLDTNGVYEGAPATKRQPNNTNSQSWVAMP